MSYRIVFNKPHFTEREEMRRRIHASRLQRRLPTIAAHHGLPVEELKALAEGSFYLCAICFLAMPTVYVYRVDGEPRALLCGHCISAIEKVDGDWMTLRKHRRFNTDYVRNRGRLARFMALHSDA